MMKSESYVASKPPTINEVIDVMGHGIGLHRSSVKLPHQTFYVDGIKVNPTPSREVKALGIRVDGTKVRITSTYYEVI